MMLSTIATKSRAVRRLLTFGLLLAVLGVIVPDAGHPDARFGLVKVDGVHGVDAADHVTWILALGSDARPGQPVLGSRSDAIQLVGINAKTGSGVIIGIPRDTYLNIPGHGSDKINAGMVYGGPQGMADAVAGYVGITPDYVFTTSFTGLIKMVKGVGGVRAKVTYFMDDQGQVFHPGMHTFTGVEALAFSRVRHGLPGGDFDRSMDQGQLLKGGLATMKAKLDKPGFYEKALSLMARWTDTNLGPVELYRLGRTVTEVDPSKVRGCVIIGGFGMAGAASIVVPNYAKAHAIARDVRNDAKLDHGC
jgi:LCP family protein required for cell wall assembly